MKTTYKKTKTTVSFINYHFVFCPRYRRKIFNISGLEEIFKKLIVKKSESIGIEVIAMECDQDHCHLFLNCPPALSPSDVMKELKGYTSKILREEFSEISKMQNLWTRSYFVSTADNISSGTIKRYVEEQKKRY
jgi:putative transposase